MKNYLTAKKQKSKKKKTSRREKNKTMKKENIETYFKEIEGVQKSKKILDNLIIEWETDLDKMNFSALRSQYDFNPNEVHQKVWIDKIDLANEFDGIEAATLEREFLNDKATIDLINFIAEGNKIIPALYVKQLEFCGGTFTYKDITGVQRNDGSHRIFVSKFIGLNKIPAIMCERVTKFTFPLDKWEFECTDEVLTAQSKSSSHKLEFDMNANYNLNNDGLFDNSLIICR